MKKILAMVLSLALVAGMAITGSIAYLQDTDESVNVMTLGEVKIKQHEYERAVDANGDYITVYSEDYQKNSYKVTEFTQNKPLYPLVNTTGKGMHWDDTSVYFDQLDENASGGTYVFHSDIKNVQDKFVVVENTGKSDAFVRTFIAFELGSVNENEFFYNSTTDTGLILTNFNNAWGWNEIGAVEIDGNYYYVVECVYNGASPSYPHKDGILPAGAYTSNSLGQIYMASRATNEDCEALDGNNNGTYDILVLSQAVQTMGFEDKGAAYALNTAFNAAAKGEEGPTPADIQTWFANMHIPGTAMKVSSNEGLKDAIEAGETNLKLSAGTFTMPDAAKGKNLTISGAGADTVIEVVPCNVPGAEAGGQLDYSLDGSTVTFNDLTIKTNSQLYAGYARLSGTYNNCTIQNTYNLGVGNSTFNNCTFNITNEYLRVGGAYSAEFNGCTFNTDGRAILVYQDGTSVAQTVTVKDCTFNATAKANTWNGIHVAAVSIDGTNGTYTVNLEGNNTVDSNFNGLWQIKAGEANVTVNE